MTKFPISCTCGRDVLTTNDDNDDDEGLNVVACGLCQQQIHVSAMAFLKALGRHELHHAMISSDCFTEIARCLQRTSTPQVGDRPLLYLEAWNFMKAVCDGPSVQHDQQMVPNEARSS